MNRPSQVPYMNESKDQNDGIFAPTLRYHNGVFYLIVVYVFRQPPGGVRGLVFKTTDPYDNAAWGEPLRYNTTAIDPDLFWEDGKVYVTQSGISQMTLGLETGATSESVWLWNGTGWPWPEGPHIYKRKENYYLLIGEGGTETNHSVTMARSEKISGPYESFAGNPVLSNRGTDEYFQTIGHADLFQDANGEWWGCALATRSGPEWVNYPMGRETILFPVTWEEGQYPVMTPVQGRMNGWQMPPRNLRLLGKGPFVGALDVVDFAPGSEIPPHFSFWRWPKRESFTISPPSHPNTLRLLPSETITAEPVSLAGGDGITLMLRLQTDTLFTFNLDVSFQPKIAKEEVGVTVFLTQAQHIDLGIVLAPSSNSSPELIPHFNMSMTGQGRYEGVVPAPILKPIPKAWLHKPISLQIQAKNDTHYTFSAASSSNRHARIVIGDAPATIVSGVTGQFTGTFNPIFWIQVK